MILKEVGAILENAEQSGLALTASEVLSLKVFHHVLQVSGDLYVTIYSTHNLTDVDTNADHYSPQNTSGRV